MLLRASARQRHGDTATRRRGGGNRLVPPRVAASVFVVVSPLFPRVVCPGHTWFVDPHLAPEPLRGELGTFSQRLELGPGNFGMAHSRTKPAVRPGDHPLAAYQSGIFNKTLCYQLRLLSRVWRVPNPFCLP